MSTDSGTPSDEEGGIVLTLSCSKSSELEAPWRLCSVTPDTGDKAELQIGFPPSLPEPLLHSPVVIHCPVGCGWSLQNTDVGPWG